MVVVGWSVWTKVAPATGPVATRNILCVLTWPVIGCTLFILSVSAPVPTVETLLPVPKTGPFVDVGAGAGARKKINHIEKIAKRSIPPTTTTKNVIRLVFIVVTA